MSPLRKVKKVKIATKAPKHQIPQNKDYQQNIIDEVLCFSASDKSEQVLVAKKKLFGVGSSINCIY